MSNGEQSCSPGSASDTFISDCGTDKSPVLQTPVNAAWSRITRDGELAQRAFVVALRNALVGSSLPDFLMDAVARRYFVIGFELGHAIVCDPVDWVAFDRTL